MNSAFSFTNADDYTQLLTELHADYCRDMPDDILQYCANFFNRKLEKQRLTLRAQEGLSFPVNKYHPLSGNMVDQDDKIVNQDHLVDDSDDDNDYKDDELHDHFTTELLSDNPPPSYNRGRRTSVSAESMAPTQGRDYVKKMIAKTTDQCDRIRQSVGNNFLFKNLDEEHYQDVVDAMAENRVSQGQTVIGQGAVGDFFYVVESGTFDCFIAKGSSHPVKMTQYEAGGSFGELALMYNAPRAATIVATADAVLWALDRVTFRTILMENTSRKRRMYESFLEEVPLLKSLEPYERHKIADALDTVYFDQGDKVVTEGDVGDRFYIIESGKATVYRFDHDDVEKEVNALGRGNYFGELALLNDTPRVATVVAQSRLKCATLGKKAFTRLLGPILEILKRNSENYNAIISEQER